MAPAERGHLVGRRDARGYLVGLPVAVRVEGGTVTLTVDLSEVDGGITDDENAAQLYPDDVVDRDATLIRGLTGPRPFHTFTLEVTP